MKKNFYKTLLGLLSVLFLISSCITSASSIPIPPSSDIDAKRADNEIRFKMTLQHSSDNIDWYSTNSNKRLLNQMAARVEPKLSQFVEWFGIESSSRIEVWYYNTDHWNIAFKNEPIFDKGNIYTGNAIRPNIIVVTRPTFATSLDDIIIGTLIHESVHIVQFNSHKSHGYDWINEGTADYLTLPRSWGWSKSNIISAVRNNNIPTLAILENKFREENFKNGIPMNYGWGCTIIEFIDKTWGFDYVVKLNKLELPYDGIDFIDYAYRLFGIPKLEFQEQWYQYLRKNYS